MTLDRNTPLLERPLAARSVIASLLLRSVPPRIPGRRLVQWCELFGIAEGTARVALSRMVDRGELRAVDGTYELAGRVGGRRAAQDFSLAPALAAWLGDWSVAVVVGAGRAAEERSALRDAMRTLRYAQLREGVWARPDNIPAAGRAADAWAIARQQCSWWTGQPGDDPVALAAQLFAPAGWAGRARMLVEHLHRATAAVAGSEEAALADAFVAGAASVAHLRADPLLPPELCPGPWPGPELRAAYGDYEQAFSSAVQAWFRRH
jgi:phenylacetic acid degradation operon negative regulatory protein